MKDYALKNERQRGQTPVRSWKLELMQQVQYK